MKLYYEGDESGGQILPWFKLQLKAIGTLWDAELPEHVLTIIYSGIDSFGLLAAPPGVLDASGTTFMQWCARYILTDDKLLMVPRSRQWTYGRDDAVYCIRQPHFRS